MKQNAQLLPVGLVPLDLLFLSNLWTGLMFVE